MSSQNSTPGLTGKAVPKSRATRTFNKTKLPARHQPEVNKLVLKLIDSKLKSAKPAGIKKALERIGGILQKPIFGRDTLNTQMDLLPFILSKETRLLSQEIQSLVKTFKNLATLVACRLITKDVDSELNAIYANTILRNAAVPADQLHSALASSRLSPFPISSDLLRITHEAFSDYLKIMENELGYSIETHLQTRSAPIFRKVSHDFSIYDLKAFTPAEKAAQFLLPHLQNSDQIVPEISRILPELPVADIQKAVQSTLNAYTQLVSVIVPALDVSPSDYNFIHSILADPDQPNWSRRINQYADRKGIDSSELAAGVKLYYLALTGRLSDSSGALPVLVSARTEKTEKVQIPAGKLRKITKQKDLVQKDSLERIRESAFRDGQDLRDDSLKEIPLQVWKQVYSQIGNILNEYGDDSKIIQDAFSNLPHAVSEEFNLPLYHVKAAFNLFQVAINQMCSFSSGTTWLQKAEDIKFSQAIRQTLELAPPGSLNPETIRNLGGIKQLYMGLVAFDAKLAGIEKYLGYPLRNWIFFPVGRLINKPVQSTADNDPGLITESANTNKIPGKKPKFSESLTKVSQQVVSDLHVDPQVLFFALCSLKLEKENVNSYREFGERIIRAPHPGSSNPESPINIICQLISESTKSGLTIRYDDLFRNRLCDLLKQLCYRCYDGDVHKIIEELKRGELIAKSAEDNLSREIINTLLKDITPRLIRLFSEIENYSDPKTVKFKLLKEQIEGVVGAIEFGKPLLLYGTGTGKTEIAVSYCEKIQAETVLWGTKTGSVYDTSERLRTRMLTEDAGSIGVLEAKLANLSTEDFKTFLKTHRYIVAGYDALRLLSQNSPENYALLQQWVKQGTKVLDELHVLDNPKSGMSKAVQGLVSESTISLTATPFQHKPERVATILHLCLPHIFPDPEQLLKELKEDRSLIRSKISAYSTIYNITDIAQYFEESDRPLAEQITAQTPRIPQLEFSRVKYRLSVEHSHLYIYLAFNYRRFAERAGIPNTPIYQIAMLQRLLSNPVKLVAAPAFSLLAKAKEIALPKLERGEKVLLFAYNHSIIDLIAEDPEFQTHGIVCLDGRMKPRERILQLKRLEDDPDCRCAIAQPKSAGSGSNCRSVSQIIVLDCDRRWMTSDRTQAYGRPIRLLFPGDERFARLKVNITTLEPELDPEVTAEIATNVGLTELTKRLSRGTIYSYWIDRDERALQAFRYFTARGNSHSVLPQAASASSLVYRLRDTLSDRNTTSGEQFSAMKVTPQGFYNNHIKNVWRQVCHGEFLAREIKLLGKDPSEIKVAHFAGPEALEIPWYLELGVKPQNIIGFSVGSRQEIDKCRESVLRHGCQFIGTSAQQALPLLETHFDIISIDPEGYSTDSLGQMILSLKLTDNAIIIKNALAAREQGIAKEMLKRAGRKRQYLDVAFMKLCATAGLNPHKFESMIEAIKTGRMILATSMVMAEEIADKLDLKATELADFISDLYMGSWHIQAFSQIRYNSGSGSPFLSTCARLEKWNSAERDSMLELRQYFERILNENISSSIKTRSGEISAAALSGSLLLTHEQAGSININIRTFRKVFSNFSMKVPVEFRLRELLKYDVPVLKFYLSQDH